MYIGHRLVGIESGEVGHTSHIQEAPRGAEGFRLVELGGKCWWTVVGSEGRWICRCRDVTVQVCKVWCGPEAPELSKSQCRP